MVLRGTEDVNMMSPFTIRSICLKKHPHNVCEEVEIVFVFVCVRVNERVYDNMLVGLHIWDYVCACLHSGLRVQVCVFVCLHMGYCVLRACARICARACARLFARTL